MSTDVRTFTAESMQQALDIVRQEMGPDAVILHTRQIARRRMFPWPKSIQEVEITAGMGLNVRAVAATPVVSPAASTPLRSRVATADNHAAAKPARRFVEDDLAPPPPLLKTEPEPSTAPRPATVVAPSLPKPAPLKPVATPQPTPAKAASLTPKPLTRPTPGPSATDAMHANPATAEIHKRLDALQQAITELTRQAKLRVADEIPVELFPHYTRLLDADIDETTAREFTVRLKREASPTQLADPAACAALLRTMIEREIRCVSPIRAVRGRRKVVALVGPTGVGKTTTIAKLAANFRLREGLKVGLVTIDTYRVAAVEQLRTYAEIIDLPMRVVTSGVELRQALEEFSGLDLVLVDTAGRSPNDDLSMQDLKSLVTETGVDEVHLVLSLAGGGHTLEETAARFSSLKITSVILTKLDEALRAGSLLTASRRVRWPLSYVTTGQKVPEDIEPANAAKLAGWVLTTNN